MRGQHPLVGSLVMAQGVSGTQSAMDLAVVSNPNQSSSTFEQSVEHITTIFKSLPSIPTVEDFEAISSILAPLLAKEEANLEQIANWESPDDLPFELFSLLQAMKKVMEAGSGVAQLIEVHEMFRRLDELLLRADGGLAQLEELQNWDDPVAEIDQKSGISDGNLIKMVEVEELKCNSIEDLATAGTGSTEQLSLLEVAALFESYVKTGASVLDLRRKLKDRVEWLPLSLGKLLNLVEIDISENQILALPSNLGELKALRKLNIHSNQLINLPGSIGDLLNLSELNLRVNRLKSLPASFGSLICLVILDLSSNLFVNLPDSIGNLSSLERLNLESNDLEELPCRIGSCTSLVELRLDFNRLKAIPESVGHLEKLKILTLRYNKVKNLPTTLGNLQNLEELNLSFNELESIPESLCSIMSLRKLNVGGNFVDLAALPRSIGNLEMLEELDISNDQIRVLPDSFSFLSLLRVFHADETPLEVPPRHIAALGAQAVVQYMAGKRSSTFSEKLRMKRLVGGSALGNMADSTGTGLPIQNEKHDSEHESSWKKIVYIWDMDETLILLKSLLNGTYAEAFNGLKDVQRGIDIGKMWEKYILDVCDNCFFYEQIENYNQPIVHALSQYDDGCDLSHYDFSQDSISAPNDDLNKRKLAYRHRVIAHKYKQGLHSILDQKTLELWNDLYEMTDSYTDGWLSSARTLLQHCSGHKEYPTDLQPSDKSELQCIHILVTSGSLIPSLVKCMLFRLDSLMTCENVYSSWDVGKLQCFSWIKERFSGPNVQFCVIGDGWEECEAAETLRWPFVKIDPKPEGFHRFPGLTLKTVGHYLSVVYGRPDAESDNRDQITSPTLI